MCSNGTRVFVHESIIDPFLARLVERTRKMKIGDPLDEATRVGATISEAHANKVLDYVQQAQKDVCIYQLCYLYIYV